ncbi:MAG: hypothetical protein V9G20_17645 [Candidatus Promineifilaceae bacterium]
MYWLRFLVVSTCLLFVGCRSETNAVESEPTRTPQGPTVISNNPNAIIKSWEYLNPRSEEALTSFLSRDPKSIGFGPERYEAYIIWRKGGFDLVWGNFICSTQPILTINNTIIDLWLNDAIWDDCDAAQVIHAFKVELETDIPTGEWTYVIHSDAPPSP